MKKFRICGFEEREIPVFIGLKGEKKSRNKMIGL